jgi:replication factor A1
LIHSGELQRGTFLRLNSYNPQKVKDRRCGLRICRRYPLANHCRILIVTELSIAREFPLQEKIGNPTALDTFDISGHVAAYESSVAAATTATSFYGEQPPKRPTAAPARGGGFGGGAPAARGNPSGVNVYPIGDISPYQNKWTIKARVVNKSEVKTWHNSKSEGKLFNVTLLDETGEIRATAFGQEVDTFYEVLQEQHVYYISKCRVTIAKKQFSNVKNDYELMIGRDTVIELVCSLFVDHE